MTYSDKIFLKLFFALMNFFFLTLFHMEQYPQNRFNKGLADHPKSS